MDSATLVVGVRFILLAAVFALVFARLIARDQLALVLDCPVFRPAGGDIDLSFEGRERIYRCARRARS
jgi:hypothetical protein